jgi:hypothetical protein
MGSTAAIPAILVLLGVVLIFAGLFFSSRFELVVVGAVVAIAGGAFAVVSSRRGSGGPDDSGAARSQGD